MTGDERALVRRLSAIGYPECAPLPPGDDAGGVFWGDAAWLLKTDGFAVADVRLAGMPEEAIGWRAVTAVASDLLAKLAAPLGFVLALFLPGGGEADRAQAWVEGAARAARAYGAHLLGGDTNRGTPAVVASGFARAQDPLPRGGREGDHLLLLGDRWGLSGAAIDAHYRGADLAPFPRIRAAGFWPRARLALLGLIPLRRYLSGSADSSDGLAETLWQLSEASGVGIELSHLPLDPELRAYAAAHGADPEALVLYGGEEYEAVLAVRPEGRAFVAAWLEAHAVPHAWVGRMAGPVGVRLRGAPLARYGYDHFR